VVKIVSGEINSGKTTQIGQIFEQTNQGDGIISKKVMLDKDVFGYNGMRLSDKYTFPLMIHEKYYKQDVINNGKVFEKDFVGEIGPYKIYKKSLRKINALYRDFFKKKTTPLYFDEIGMLEIGKGGFYKHLKKALKRKIDVVITVREDLIEKVIDKFKIEEYEIIE